MQSAATKVPLCARELPSLTTAAAAQWSFAASGRGGAATNRYCLRQLLLRQAGAAARTAWPSSGGGATPMLSAVQQWCYVSLAEAAAADGDGATPASLCHHIIQMQLAIDEPRVERCHKSAATQASLLAEAAAADGDGAAAQHDAALAASERHAYRAAPCTLR
eukprot:TRINITY_DN23214_c0_g1_i1.p2 TRINITY_DN23214_c0_g1~~TRINITY_DN23214_c0_g1_i1.p2  ORF type:complete len:163 (+),score=29.64 TRINITY_DN23214_c0_g1_i1:245-733(+)